MENNKYLTFAFILTCIIILVFITSCKSMKNVYENERKELIGQNVNYEIKYFSNELISHLPEPIKKYLLVCGYMDTPIQFNANVYWLESYLKLSPEKEWGKLQTLQYNSVNPIARIAYMKFLSMPVSARDIYRNGYGEMKGKLFNLFRVVYDNSRETAQSALITAFCEFLFIPGYILSDKVEWVYINEKAVLAKLTDNDISVSGIFYFDDDGFFSHFETEDRYYSMGKNQYKKIKFSAIADSYKNQGKVKIVEKVRIIWHLDEGDFEYYKGIIDRIEYNIFY